jgi:tRNA (guanine37-N1)-methyltransferase
MHLHVITLFPEIFAGPLSESIIGRAAKSGLVTFNIIDLRKFCENKHRKADDAPYGGGAGMVLMADPIFKAVESLEGSNSPKRVIVTSAQGARFDQKKARELSLEEDIVIICGRYEGIDERVTLGLEAEELSIGDYVLTGGEFAALVMMDAIVRLIPGVVGSAESLDDDSFSEDLLGPPQYTRPATSRGMRVPDALVSGNHAEISEWRRREAVRKTFKNRPDLLEKASLSEEESRFIKGLRGLPIEMNEGLDGGTDKGIDEGEN